MFDRLVEELTHDWFILAVVILLVVYWQGVVGILKTAAPAAIGLDYAVTGRTQQGQFANYPGQS